DPHAVFGNAGAAGFFHEWQWAASYSKWIADVYNASFIYARKIPTPFSSQTRFGLGVLYQGVPEFNNNSDNLPPASAGDFLLSLSIGQPILLKNQTLALGVNAKYLNSTLAQYSAHSFVFDAGIMAKTTAFRVGKKLNAVIGAGFGISQMGQGLIFENMATPLPLSSKSGLSLYLGTHAGIQLICEADFITTRDEKSYWAVGSELLFHRLISISAGYDFGSDLFKKFTVGAGIRLDDVGMAIGQAFPSKHNAFRLDVASLDGGDAFARTYRGSAAHFPTVPESFTFLAPVHNDTIYSNEIILRWKPSLDFDVFDAVKYHLFVDDDSAGISHVIASYDNDPELFLALLKTPMTVNKEIEQTFTAVDNLSAGKHFWAVAAIDRDNQVRFAHGEFGKISSFYIPSPAIEIKDIQFVHHPTISMEDNQGIIRVTVENTGQRASSDFRLRWIDGIDQLDFSLASLAANDLSIGAAEKNIVTETIRSLKAGESKTVDLTWSSSLQGKHKFQFYLDMEIENPTDLPVKEEYFYTIPKGSTTVEDSTFNIQSDKKILEIPFIPNISFPISSAEISVCYTDSSTQMPTCRILAKRLVQNPQLIISLQGFIDPNSGENDLSLATRRTAAVQALLIENGVDKSQITLLDPMALSKRNFPPNTTDLEKILEERRHVSISTAKEDASLLFAPVFQTNSELSGDDIYFSTNIRSSLPVKEAAIVCATDKGKSIQSLPSFEMKKRLSGFYWRMKQSDLNMLLGQTASYTIMFTDSLGRQFSSKTLIAHFHENERINEYVHTISLQFASTDPIMALNGREFKLLVEKMLSDPEIRVRIEGHACSIGSERVNQNLSQRRAERFTTAFINQLELSDNKELSRLAQRLDAPVGWGESRPLSMSQNSNENETSLERMVNRRIEIIFYRKGVRT
ncbi:MAG: hypothetical protein EHM72_09425, partial [Calditrichaeota bacterium]